MKEILYIKYLLLKRDIDRSWHGFWERRRPGSKFNLESEKQVKLVGVNRERRKLLKLAGIGAAAVAISALGADKLLEQKEDKKLVFRDKRGRPVLEVG